MLTLMLQFLYACGFLKILLKIIFSGLEDQLLPLVIQNERAELETTKEKLVKSISDNKRQLADIEDTILRLLNEAKGSLLDDEVLVQALKKSKLASLDIEEKLKKDQETELVIDALRDNYRPCAKMASILYFVLTDMTFVDSMYVFTLDSYITLFLSSISKSPRDPNIPRRISNLNAFHQRAVYRYACRTICEKHSLLLAFHMCTKIMRSLGKIHNEEYNFFIKGGQVIDRSEEPPNPCSLWLPQHCWDHITQLERLPKFLGITVSFDEISRMWQDWYTTAEPEKIYLPGNWRNICDEFQRLLIIRCLRPDRITNCISNFVDKNLGKGFLVYPGMDLSEIVKESTSNKPLVVFTLSSYIDPEQIIQNLAETCGMADRYRAISLGQGQEVVASQLIVDAAKMGFWAFLSNCHLLIDWFPALEKIVNKIVTLKIHPNFRLWLGLHPASTFPTSVLQNSMIITLESPKGIKANMLKLYDSLEKEGEIESSGNMGKYKSLLFTLSFFHSVLLERNRFQHLGWNNVYMFTEADFQMAKMLFETYLNYYKDTPWDALKDAIEITYGGHLTDDRDEILLTTYYEQYFCDEVYANIKFPLSSVSHYYVPEEGPMSSYVQFIKNLPTVDVPEVFEQHCNAEIPYRIHHAQELLKNMSKFQNESFTQSGNMENQVIVIISEIKENLPSLIDKQAVTGILQDKNDPYCYILMQESEQYNALVELVSEEIKDLEESIKGKRIINQKLEELSDVMLRMEVPRHWQKAYPSLKPLGSWIQDLKMRVEQFHDWSSSGSPPIKFWLPGFTAPSSVLNAALQISAKENDVMLRDLVWEYHVSTLDEAHIKEAPPVRQKLITYIQLDR
ncbi:dynein heavy chain 2, axonemal-like [Stegodyphus dumicola]|uniref:dynein heavy chain 2, axonemal-like n=1 Tax=Stegodyphus dumicola TaxID=202533 RepID=UPI0015B160D3|nr:dynein heavy chain 2, axonemal-like [Stegodyphus dumicola]